jgi:hypothetical protein
MKIDYRITGDRRKSLARAVSSALNAPTQYLGMPSAAYQIGDFILSKTGELTGPDDRDLVMALRAAHGFESVGEEYDGAKGAEPDIDPHNPGRCADPSEPPTAEMLKQAEDWAEKADAAPADEPDESNESDHLTALSDAPDAPDRLTIEVPLQGFTPEKLNNLTRMVAAKAPLLKLALGEEELPIQVGEKTIRFPWFQRTDGEHAQAYAALVSLLCKAALQKKRVTAKEKPVPENAKYTLRCFLLSIGMIGDEYKTARKILLSNLSGSSAWKDGARKEAVDDAVSR